MVDITTGGIRDRLIRDAAAKLLVDALTQLHWFDPANAAPLTFVDHAVAPGSQVELGTMALTMDDVPLDDEIELGSNFTEYRYAMFVDLYGWDQDSARQAIGDVRDILLGKMPGIGAAFPILDVYDTTGGAPGPDPAFQLNIQAVHANPGLRDVTKPWQEFWFECSFELVEER